MISEFSASSWDDLRPHYLTGDEMDRHFRMVSSYWDLVAAFVNRGLIDEELFFDVTGEDIIVWSKIEAVVPGMRAHLRPTYLWNLERMARRHKAWREATYATAERVIAEGSVLRGARPVQEPPRKGGKNKKTKKRDR
jgi:hypothetical protein